MTVPSAHSTPRRDGRIPIDFTDSSNGSYESVIVKTAGRGKNSTEGLPAAKDTEKGIDSSFLDIPLVVYTIGRWICVSITMEGRTRADLGMEGESREQSVN